MYHKLRLSWIPSVIVIAGVLLIGSCKDEEEPKSNVSFTFAGDDALESDGTVEVDVELDKQLAQDVVISYTLGGDADSDDYDISPAGGSIVIPANTDFATFEIELNDDGLAEGEEDLTITLTGVTAGHAQVKPSFNVFALNIEDTGFPVANISFTYEDTLVWETDGIINVRIKADRPLADAAVISFTINPGSPNAVMGEDYEIMTSASVTESTITIPAGASEAIIPVEVFEDFDFEVYQVSNNQVAT